MNMDNPPEDEDWIDRLFRDDEEVNDSDILKYMSELSTIQPADEPVHDIQTLSSTNSCSPSSDLTSPHVSYCQEPRFLRSHQSNVSFEPDLQAASNEAALSYTRHVNQVSSELQGNTDEGNVLAEHSRKCTLDIPQASTYDRGRLVYDETYDYNGLVYDEINFDAEELLAPVPEGLIMQKLSDSTIRPSNFMPQPPQNEIRDDHASNPNATTETEQMQSSPFNFGVMDGNRNESMDNEHRGFLGYGMAGMPYMMPGTANINSHTMPGTAMQDSVIMNNGWPPTRQPIQSNNLASSCLHQTSSPYHLQPPIIGAGFNENRSNKRRLDTAREGEGRKSCRCKSTQCLKRYCECFSSRVYCNGLCSCRNCFNNPNHKDKVIATRKIIETRNPSAFSPKVIRNAYSLPETRVGPSIRHRKGCSCPKSECQKKYCECYQNGVGCSISCRCKECKNAYGKNLCSCGLRIESGAQRTEPFDYMLMAEEGPQITETPNNEGHPNYVAPSPTPSLPFRSGTPLDGSPWRERPSGVIIPASPGFHASQRLDCEESRFENNFQSNNEQGMRQIHQVGDGSSRREQPSNFSILASLGFNPSQRLDENNILHSQPRFENNLQSNNELGMPQIHQVGDRRGPPSNFSIPASPRFNASQRPDENNILHSQPRVENNFQSNNELGMPQIHQVGDCSSWREWPSNFNIPPSLGFNASQRLDRNNIIHSQPRFENNFQSNNELGMLQIHQAGDHDGSSIPYNNSFYSSDGAWDQIFPCPGSSFPPQNPHQ